MRINIYHLELNDDRLNVLVKEKGTNYTYCNALNNPIDITRLMTDMFHMDVLAEESIYLLATDTKMHPIAIFLLSKGTVNASILAPREVFVRLLLCGASNFVLVHNHPSGDPSPSNDDKYSTKRITEVSKLIGVHLQDHIIIGSNYRYWSFKENGEI